MNLLKTFVAASVIALASFSVNASQIQSGGITWNPDYTSGLGEDFFAAAAYSQEFIAGSSRGGITTGDSVLFSDLAIGDTLRGYGAISELNGQYPTAYCVTCTELTFAYSDFEVTATTGIGAPLFTGGSLGFYVNNGQRLADTTGSLFNNASAGALWLDLVSSSTVGTDLTGTANTDGLTSYFDIVSTAGTAAGNFNTNSLAYGADMAFTGNIFNGTNAGRGEFVGNSIPEPTSLAIFGLGLLGLAGAARRKA